MPALLLSFPLQQTVVALGPEDQSLATNALLTLPLIMLAAFGLHHVLRLARVSKPATTQQESEPTWRKGRSRKRPFAQRLRDTVLNVALVLILATIAFAVLGLTYYALQRDAVGI